MVRDGVGRVTSQTLPDGRVVQFTYDANGNLTSLTPPGRPAHAFTYTPIDLAKDYLAPAVTGGGTQQTQYAYDLDRQLTTVTRPDGQQVTLDYDGAGRLSGQTTPSGSFSYGYDSAGRLGTLTAPSGETFTYSYDGALLTDVTWAGPIAGSIGLTYDPDFRVRSQSLNGGEPVYFAYDADGLLAGAGDLGLARDPQNGLLTGTTLGSVTDTLSYSAFGEPNQYQATVDGSAVFSQQYTRDALGRLTTKTETLQGVTDTYGYTYDTAGRLSEVQKNGLTLASYTYDPNSNRLSKAVPAGTTAYTYDAQDRLLTAGGTTYTYTANGELSTVTRSPSPVPSSYQYDVLGNLLSATLPDGTQIEYVIDGQSRRIGKKVNGTLVQGFLYQSQLQPVAELDGAGNAVARFVYASRANVPDYILKGGVTYRILADHLGSPRLIVDTTTGAIAQRLDYDEFGTVITDTNPGFQPFGFAGGLYDRDTKLVRFGARDYDAEAGRWTAKDPIGFAGGDTNLYGYVLNDPVNLVDPTGHFVPLLPFVTGLVGMLTALLANLAVQLARTGGDWRCIDPKALFTAGFSGLIQGLLLPQVGGGAARAAGLGFVGNALATWLTGGSVIDIVVNAALGAAGGAIAGAAGAAGGLRFAPDSILSKLGPAARGINDLRDAAANRDALSVLKNLLGNLVSNLFPGTGEGDPCPCAQ